MPCFVTGSEMGDKELAFQETKEKLQQQITELTRLLCQSCKKLEKEDLTIPKEVKSWWKKHKKIDEAL